MSLSTLGAGLWAPRKLETHEVLQASFRSGTPNVSDAVGVNLEMLSLLGGVIDSNREAVEAEISDSFNKLAQLGFGGELMIIPSGNQVPFENLWAAAEGKRPDKVAEGFCWPNLWVSGTEAESYRREDLDGTRTSAVARLVVFSALETGFDRRLHYLGLPFDQYAKERWDPDAETTQTDALAHDQAAFAGQHTGFDLEASDHRNYLVDALLARIKGVNPSSIEFPLNRGCMRVAPEMGWHMVGGGSVVGAVSPDSGRLGLYWGLGWEDSDSGVGLSVGQIEQPVA